VEGKLYLSGVDPALVEQFERAGHVATGGPVGIVEATNRLGESTRAAYQDAEAWLIGDRSTDGPAAEPAQSNQNAAWFRRFFGKG
jgi:SulP family sulfate permease